MSEKPICTELDVEVTDEITRRFRIDDETMAHFGTGICRTPCPLQDLFVFPVHSDKGLLLGYGAYFEQHDRWVLPVDSENWLFNLHRVIEQSSREDGVVLVVEPLDCMRLDQAGHFCVALMEDNITNAQEALLDEHLSKVILVGETRKWSQRLVQKLFVRVVDLPEGISLSQLDEDELQLLV
jgi:hypothetical protein